MGLETPSEYGGAECSFTAAILAVEELAKIDPSISALCDIHVSCWQCLVSRAAWSGI